MSNCTFSSEGTKGRLWKATLCLQRVLCLIDCINFVVSAVDVLCLFKLPQDMSKKLC